MVPKAYRLPFVIFALNVPSDIPATLRGKSPCLYNPAGEGLVFQVIASCPTGAFRLFTKIKNVFRNQLTQGASPEALARACAVSAFVSVFPLIGTTAFLCLFAGFLIRGNQPVMHVVNYLLYPAQLLLIPVYLYIGEWIVGAPHVTINPVVMFNKMTADAGSFFAEYGWAGAYAVLAWAIITPPCAWLLYLGLKPLFRRLLNRAVVVQAR